MKYAAVVHLTIDTGLRFALFGLECAFGVSFNGVEYERIFHDLINDHISAKDYSLYQSKILIVTCRVEEYEPETIRIQVKGVSEVEAILTRVIDQAQNHAFRLDRSVEGTIQRHIA